MGRCSMALNVDRFLKLDGMAMSNATRYTANNKNHQRMAIPVRFACVMYSIRQTKKMSIKMPMKMILGGSRLMNNLFQKSFVFVGIFSFFEKNRDRCDNCDSSHLRR